MVEIRTYDGSAEDLQTFVVRVWRETYGGKKMAFPLWTPDYFRWQLPMESNDSKAREQLIVAYDGTKLVGAILGFPCRFRTPQGEVAGSQGSWLSVDRDFRRQGVATLMRQELRQRHAALGLDFQIGYGYFGSPDSMGPAFWASQRELGTVPAGQIGFWARVLHAGRAAAWNVVGWESWLTRGFGWMALPPWESAGSLTLRDFRPDDLPVCLELVQRETANCDLAIAWEPQQLSRQLAGGGVGQTLVAESNGQVRGFVNWHCLPFLGRTEEIVAVVDLVVLSGLGAIEQHRLLNSALYRMKTSGAALALKLRIGDYVARPLVTCGFVPRWPDSTVLATWGGEPRPWPALRRMHLLWR
ncbi:MAG: GNAT family N-acetyltransferase [Planctomycetaceae bacterium]